jgi:hypothetical protein
MPRATKDTRKKCLFFSMRTEVRSPHGVGRRRTSFREHKPYLIARPFHLRLAPTEKNHLLRAKLQLLYTAVITTTKHFFLYPKTLYFFSHRDSWVALPTLVSPLLRRQAGRRLEDCFFFSFSIYLGRGPGGMPWGGNTSLKNPSLYLIS